MATAYRDLGPQAHHPTGSPATEAKIPIGAGLAVAMASKRCLLPPFSQQMANVLRLSQNAMHQQRRVFL
jgi:hypothetical protein